MSLVDGNGNQRTVSSAISRGNGRDSEKFQREGTLSGTERWPVLVQVSSYSSQSVI